MSMKRIIHTLIILYSATVFAETPPEPIVLSGEKTIVLNALREAINNEFSPSTVTPLDDRLGFYFEFWSGKTWNTMKFSTSIYPWLSNGLEPSIVNSVEVIDESDDASLHAASASQHIVDLQRAILNVASNHSEIKTIKSPSTSYRPAKLLAVECFRSIPSAPELTSIRMKVALSGVSDTTIAMLADSRTPNATEKTAIYWWAEKREACYNIRSLHHSYLPGFSENIYDREFVEGTTQLILSLYSGAISFGEFSKQRKNFAIAIEKKFSEDQAAKLRRLEDTELRIREVAAFESMARRPQAVIAPATSLNCTSSSIGKTVYTSCY